MRMVDKKLPTSDEKFGREVTRCVHCCDGFSLGAPTKNANNAVVQGDHGKDELCTQIRPGSANSLPSAVFPTEAFKEEIWSSTIMTQCGTWQARLLKQLGFERKGSKNLWH
jgi:hypothetical protein